LPQAGRGRSTQTDCQRRRSPCRAGVGAWVPSGLPVQVRIETWTRRVVVDQIFPRARNRAAGWRTA
jgi:hypothetical protein